MPSRAAGAERPTPPVVTRLKTRRRTSPTSSARSAIPCTCSDIRTAPTARCLAAARQPHRVRKLVLYEPAWPTALRPDALAALETLAAADAWDQLAYAFFANLLHVPTEELDARARLGPLAPDRGRRASRRSGTFVRYARTDFDPARFAGLDVPVLLQIGSESPRDLYVTDALAAVLPDARIDTLAGQAHEGMTTAPEMYAQTTMQFLLAGSSDPLTPSTRLSSERVSGEW